MTEQTNAPLWPEHHEPEWTEDDLMRMPDDGNRYEVLWGSLIVTPLQSESHQRIELNIAMALASSVPENWHALPRLGVRLADGNVEPDFVVLRPAALLNVHYNDAQNVALVVEIASRTTQVRDASSKLEAYAESGIPVYLRAIPGERSAVHVHTRPVPSDDEEDPPVYKESVVVPLGRTYEMTEPFPFTVDPERWLA